MLRLRVEAGGIKRGCMDKKRVHVWVTGRVQGVFFRDYTRSEAVKLGLHGWVMNLPDGRVEAVFEGDADKVELMLAWCRKGSPLSRVDGLEVAEETGRGEFHRFEIQYYGR